MKNSERWRQNTLNPFIKKAKLRTDLAGLSDDSAVADLYHSELPIDSDNIGMPGEYPYTRGVYPSMYRGRFWTMRQYAGFGTAQETNERFRYLLDAGQTGLSVAFDLPTQMGLDSDDPLSNGEVGRVGVAIDSIRDMEALFKHIPLGRVSTSMTINSTAAILLCFYMAVGEAQGVEPRLLRGTIQNDILKEYIARGTYIYPPKPSMRLITDIFSFCKQELPRFNTVSISGYHIREAGATAVQEVAFTLADGIAYVEAALKAGLKIDEFAPRLSFFFNAHNNFLEEIAKFRAARRLWANIMKNRFKAQNPKSMMLRFHTQTGGSTLTAQQPENNITRVALQALAAVMGGTQSLHTNGMDEALALPSELSAKTALRTQQIIAYESGVTDFVDPFAGSYAIESMTDSIETEAAAYIESIDKMGGMIEAIEEGFPQTEILDTAYRYQQTVDAKTRTVVGVNRFQAEEPLRADLSRLDPALESSQIENLRNFKASRQEGPLNNSLSKLKTTAKGAENLVPVILSCVKAGATLGEISNALKTVFGAYRPSVNL